jgi:hypothetical protein
MNWKKSSYSGANGCVQVRCSSTNNCVDVSHQDGRILVRDSKLGDDSPVIEFAPESWRFFVASVKVWDRRGGIFSGGVSLSVWHWPDGEEAVCIVDHEVRHLHFDWDEWDAFVKGVEAGEFTPEVLSR